MKMTSKEFAAKFHPKKGDEFIIWKDDEIHVGFSVLRDYKKGIGFIPAVTRAGEEDTKALIKVGIRVCETPPKRIPVLLSASKHSKYLGSHFDINFKDKDAPTRTSLNKSKNSKQPVDLESRDEFTMEVNSGLFFRKKTNEIISIVELVDWIYDLYIKTISSGKGRILKVKINFKNVICIKIVPKLIFYSKKFLSFFGKEIEGDNTDFAVGLFKPYSFKKHIKTKYPYSLPFFNVDYRVALSNILWVSVLLFVLWYFYFAKHNINGIFSISLSVILIFIFEFAIPFFILTIINMLIIFRSWYERKRFKFK